MPRNASSFRAMSTEIRFLSWTISEIIPFDTEHLAASWVWLMVLCLSSSLSSWIAGLILGMVFILFYCVLEILVLVSVFNFYQGYVLELVIMPLKGDSPFGFSRFGID